MTAWLRPSIPASAILKNFLQPELSPSLAEGCGVGWDEEWGEKLRGASGAPALVGLDWVELGWVWWVGVGQMCGVVGWVWWVELGWVWWVGVSCVWRARVGPHESPLACETGNVPAIHHTVVAGPAAKA